MPSGLRQQDGNDPDELAATQLLHFSSRERVSVTEADPTEDTTPSRSDADEAPTFVGDLNPESILIHAVTGDSDPAVPGVWYKRPHQQSEDSSRELGMGRRSKKAREAGSASEYSKDKRAASEPDETLAEDTEAEGVRKPGGRSSRPQELRERGSTDGLGDSADGPTSALDESDEMHGAARMASVFPRSQDLKMSEYPCICGRRRRSMLQCFACLRDHISWAQFRAADMMAAEVLPPTEASWNGIKEVYLRKIYPIFPIFDKTRLETILGPWCKDSPPLRRIDQLVVASVCHAVSLDREASPFLCFRTEPHKPVEQLLYRDTLVATITEYVVKQCDKKRYLFDYIRSMTLLCFFWQGASFFRRPLSVTGVSYRNSSCSVSATHLLAGISKRDSMSCLAYGPSFILSHLRGR